MCATNSRHADAAAQPRTAFGLGAVTAGARTMNTTADNACPSTSSLSAEEKAAARKVRAAQKARAKTEAKLLTQVKAQGVLHKTMSHEAASGSYFNLPSGRVLHRETCERLIAEGRLVARNDGLFGDSQTYVVGASQ